MTFERHIVALVGLSGVGKTTLVKQLAGEIPLLHLQASSLIKSELERQARNFTPDELANRNIDKNQQLLVSAFKRATYDAAQVPIILDGHVIVDTGSGIEEIQSSVFAELGVTSFWFVREAPDEIIKRRLSDKERRRPARDLDDIARQQDLALEVCTKIARSLNKPMTIMTSETPERLLEYINSGA